MGLGKNMQCKLNCFLSREITLQNLLGGPFYLYRANGRGGFGSRTAADPSGDPPKVPKKQTVGTVMASHKC